MAVTVLEQAVIRAIPIGAAGNAGLNGEYRVYNTRAGAIATTIPAGASAILVLGYTTVGDTEMVAYKRRVGVPAHSGYFQSADQVAGGGTEYWERLGHVVDPLEFGAVGNGSTDDVLAWQGACNYLNLVGGKLRVTKRHALSGVGTITRSGTKFEFMDAGELLSIGSTHKFGLLTIDPSPAVLATTIGASSARGSYNIGLASVAGITVGMMARFILTRDIPPSGPSQYAKSFTAIVLGIGGLVLSLSHPLPWATILNEDVSVHFANPITDISIRDFKANGSGHVPGANWNAALRLKHVLHPEISGLRATKFKKGCLILEAALGHSVKHMTLYDNGGLTADGNVPIDIQGVTDGTVSDYSVYYSDNFGIQANFWHYCKHRDFEISHIYGRAVKFSDCSDTETSGFTLINNFGMGLGLDGDSSYNSFVNGNIRNTMTNPVDGSLGIGLWLNNISNIHDRFLNVTVTGSAYIDWTVGSADIDCSAVNCEAGTFEINPDVLIVPLVGSHSFRWQSSKSGFLRINRAANQTIARTALALEYRKIQFDNYIVDLGNRWSTSTWQFTAPSRGEVTIIAAMRAEIPAGGRGTYLAIFKGETEMKAIRLVPGSVIDLPIMMGVFDCNPADVFSIRLSHNHGSTDAIVYAGVGSTLEVSFR